MPRFRFRLQAVLEHREMVEEERQRSVAALERERVRLEDAIRACQRSIERERDELRSGLGGGDIRGAKLQSAAMLRFITDAQRHVLELAGVLKRLERARAALLEAATARKAVELLRERQLSEWRSAERRAEASETDELAVMRAGRKVDP